MKIEGILVRAAGRKGSIPITPVTAANWGKFASSLAPQARAWAASLGFAGEPGKHIVLPGEDGRPAQVLFGAGGEEAFAFGKLAKALPKGRYRVDGSLPGARLGVLSWLLEAYEFTAYRASTANVSELECPLGVDRDEILRLASAATLARDLINTPSADMGPDELESAARRVAIPFKARIGVTRGKALASGFPMIEAVGRASPRAPRLIDFSWGNPCAPKVTLVGKGVCFDTGGLDIKPASNMQLMKKDMGGAANVLALAQMIMGEKLPIRLRVLVPAVENAIAGNAFRPGDILRSRKGLTVEIGNTDAEGRLILADALALADEESPDLLVDMATLTGAARVALGPDLAPFYTSDDGLAAQLMAHATAENDPLWRMPLWEPYSSMIDPKIADLSNSGESSFAGSITAALFLKRFVEKASRYVHFDIYAWTPAAKPGRPKGGEIQGIRALLETIRERYAGSGPV